MYFHFYRSQCKVLTLKWDFRTKAHRMLDLVLWLARYVKKSTNQVMMMTKLLRKRAEMVLKWGICYKNVRSSRKKNPVAKKKPLFPNHWNGNLPKNSKGEYIGHFTFLWYLFALNLFYAKSPLFFRMNWPFHLIARKLVFDCRLTFTSPPLEMGRNKHVSHFIYWH